jgi:DNA-binding NarL/FixJ family response regulator
VECELMKRHGITGGRDICLNCPYPKCAYDVRSQRDLDSSIRKMKFQERIEKRNRFILSMSAEGMLNTDIAQKFGICCRHVRRIVNGR